jgi:hypothetical protein
VGSCCSFNEAVRDHNCLIVQLRNRVIPEVVIGDCHLLIKVSDLRQETGVAQGKEKEELS